MAHSMLLMNVNQCTAQPAHQGKRVQPLAKILVRLNEGALVLERPTSLMPSSGNWSTTFSQPGDSKVQHFGAVTYHKAILLTGCQVIICEQTGSLEDTGYAFHMAR